MIADYADDKVILCIHYIPSIAIQKLQSHLTFMEDWYTNWRFKINHHSKYSKILNSKYLVLILDKSHHIKSKRVNLNLRLRRLKNFIDNNKHTHVNTKLFIYKSLLKPMCTYGNFGEMLRSLT